MNEDKLSFNINNSVYIKLTELGKKIYYEQYEELNKRYDKAIIDARMPIVDSEGYTKMQMWCFMHLYGEHTGMCKNLAYETEILFEEKDIK